LEIYLQDHIKAWRMQPDGSYDREQASPGEVLQDVQRWFINQRKLGSC
jgi:polyphosphate kinase